MLKIACSAGIVAAFSALALGASARAAGVACGDVLTEDTTLTADLTCASGVGLIVGAGVTVDFAGHTLSGSGTGSLGVAIDRVAATLLNGRIEGFHGDGVSVSRGAVTLENMLITSNVTGVVTFPGTATIRNSRITGNSGAALCCYSFLVRDSTISGNGDGISTVQGLDMSGSTVSGNGNRDRAGLSLNDNRVTLSGNVFVNTDVSISTTIDPITITGNRVVNGGLTIIDGNAVTLTDNVFLNNSSPDAGHAISVSPNAGYPTVTVARNRLVNQTLVVGDPLVKVVDGGGNTGNRCGTLLVCRG